jgi:hypothetical protein
MRYFVLYSTITHRVAPEKPIIHRPGVNLSMDENERDIRE